MSSSTSSSTGAAAAPASPSYSPSEPDPKRRRIGTWRYQPAPRPVKPAMPVLPQVEAVMARMTEWKIYLESLKGVVIEAQRRVRDNLIDAEMKEYMKESGKTRLKRAQDEYAWVTEDLDEEEVAGRRVTLADVVCVCGDSCYYKAHPMELDHYVSSHRLHGTMETVLCDKCFPTVITDKEITHVQVIEAIQRECNGEHSDDDEDDDEDSPMAEAAAVADDEDDDKAASTTATNAADADVIVLD